MPTTRLVLWGDSRTEGIGDVAPNIFPSFVAGLSPGVAVTGAGRSGQTAAEVVARQGGVPARLTLAANRIPASGAVEVTGASVSIFSYALNTIEAGSVEGTLAGVDGTYAADGAGRQTFIRAAVGAEVAVPAGSPFLTRLGQQSRDATMFLCVGENGVQVQPPEEIIALTRAAVDYLTGERRYVIGGVMPDLHAVIGSAPRRAYDRLNDQLRAAHGGFYLDLSIPPSEAEMAGIGYPPTAEDRADIATGVYPRGMFQDTIHLRGAGQRIWALRLRDHLRARGYVA